MNNNTSSDGTGVAIHIERTEPNSDGSVRQHIPVLDGIRGLAILLVLVHHVTPLDTEKWVAGLSVVRWVHAGWIGVDLFFVLSGFLITGILLDDRGTPHYLRNFYARRVLRIFPLYYGVLFVLFVLTPIGLWLANLDARISGRLAGVLQGYWEIQQNQIWLWLYLSNFAEIFFQVQWKSVGHFWSLAVEEHFYVIWPAAVLFAGRRGLLSICPLIILASLGLRLAAPALGFNQGATYVLTPCRLDGLAMGGMLAVLTRVRCDLADWARVSHGLGWGAGALVVLGFYRQGSPEPGEFFCTVGFSLLAVTFTALVFGVLTASPSSFTGRLFRSRGLRFFGRYSYGIYVYNRLLILPVRLLVQPEALAIQYGSPLIGILAMQVAGTGASIGLAMLSWQLYEIHFIKLKKHFSP